MIPAARAASPRPNALRRLTLRQLECFYWVQQGKSASVIGEILGLSSRTVEGHIAKVCEILGVRTRIQAVLKLRELGLLEVPDA